MDSVISESVIEISGNYISHIMFTKDFRPKTGYEIFDVSDMYAVPGFIDLHCHGGFGIDLALNLDHGFEYFASKLAATGTTTILLSLVGSTKRNLIEVISKAVRLIRRGGYPRIAGLYLEGPFINPRRGGGIPADFVRPATLGEAIDIFEAGEGHIKIVAIAPEIEGVMEVVDFFHKNGVVVSMGHTECNYEEASRAFSNHFSHVTHLFNAMPDLRHREPGPVGAVFDSKDATAELIFDCIHVHPSVINLSIKVLGHDRIIFVTDSSPATGQPDGTYSFFGRKIKKDGVVVTGPNGLLAGSALSMDVVLKNAMDIMACDIKAVNKLISANAAKRIGIYDRVGSIEEGKVADINILDKDMNLRMCIFNGDVIYNEL